MKEYKLIGKYPKRKKGDIAIATPDDENFDFKWKDDGIGIPQDLRPDLNSDLFQEIKPKSLLNAEDIFKVSETGSIYKVTKADSDKVYITWSTYGKEMDYDTETTNKFVEEGSWIKVRPFEILSFKRVKVDARSSSELGKIFKKTTSGGYSSKDCGIHFTEECMLNMGISVASGDFQIYSVRRLYDGVKFTIGDYVKDSINDGKSYPITGLEMNTEDTNVDWLGGLGVRYGEKGRATAISIVEKADEVIEPNFTTEDGVNIYEGNEYWMVNKDFSNVWKAKCKARTEVSSYHKAFSTEEKARHYVIFNKPCISLIDLEDVLDEKIGSALTKYIIVSNVKRKAMSDGIL